MQVADVMTRASVVDSPSDSLRAAATLMWKQQTGSLLVMDGDALLGILTERDVMKAAARGYDLDRTPVSTVMTTSVATVAPDTTLPEAARHMATRWIRHLPVVADGKVVGMVSQRDLCGVFAALGSEADLLEIPADELVRARRLERVPRAGESS
jgi:CBS domain-containing protein